ncbi:hypothetical protein [Sphingorhabdus sp. SMR4y]|nr:hypothetical protein [Sphingorhabdus sp. SMR4y]
MDQISLPLRLLAGASKWHGGNYAVADMTQRLINLSKASNLA